MEKSKMVKCKWLAAFALAAAVCALLAVSAAAAGPRYDPYDDPFWQDVLQRVYFAEGGTIQADATIQDGDYVPFFILDGLRGKYLTLELTYCGQVYTLAGPHLPGLEPGLNYPFAALQGGVGSVQTKMVKIPARSGASDEVDLTVELPVDWQVSEGDKSTYYMADHSKIWFAGSGDLAEGEDLSSAWDSATPLDPEEAVSGEWGTGMDDTHKVLQRVSGSLPDGRGYYGEYLEFLAIGSMDYGYGYCYAVTLTPDTFVLVYFYTMEYDSARPPVDFEPILASIRPAP